MNGISAYWILKKSSYLGLNEGLYRINICIVQVFLELRGYVVILNYLQNYCSESRS